jgi:hypothetical protein
MTAAPCDWGVVVENCDVYDGLTDVQQARVLSMAVGFLWNWTGRSFGVCTTTVRPCRAPYRRESSFWGGGPYPMLSGQWTPVLLGGEWFNIACGRCGVECGCTHTPVLRLPGPVQTIEQIKIDGAILDPTAYRVDDERFLVRLDGSEWPACQDMNLATTEVGTFEITYTAGVPTPEGGQVAAAVLACEFAKAITAPSSCQLPKRIQNITREGVTVTLFDNFDNLEKGATGIWLIDSWVASVTKAPKPSMVYSPDIPRPRNRRTTWMDSP